MNHAVVIRSMIDITINITAMKKANVAIWSAGEIIIYFLPY
jgi:hypothetical protein